MTFPVAHPKIARVPCDSKTLKMYQWANEHVWQMFSHIYIRRLRYSARYNQLQKEPFFAHKGSLYCCKISNEKLQFHCNVKTVSLYVKMPLRDFNSFSVFLMIFGSLRLHLFPAIFVKRQWSCSSLSLFFFSVSQWTCSNFCFPKQTHSFLLSSNYNFIFIV